MAKTVLIVEDERAIVEILKFNLKREGYETLEALDGQTGLLEPYQDLTLIERLRDKSLLFGEQENRWCMAVVSSCREMLG